MEKPKLIRITTVPLSLDKLLDGQLAYMKRYYEVIAVSSQKTYLDKVGKKNGIRTYCVNMTRKITPFRDLWSVWRLFRFLRKEKPLFVHTHTPKAGTAGMIASRLAGVPHRLHTVAGLPLLEAKGIKRRLLGRVEKLTYRCATCVYPNSRRLKEIIEEENLCLPAKMKVIANGSSNGIDTSRFDPKLFTVADKEELRRENGISGFDFVFLFVGRLVTDKGINELVKAFDNFQIKYGHTKLILVGEQERELDPLKNETLEIINSNKNIICTGFMADVRPYFSISDVFVFPSYREGFPNVVMQAGAMGLPSIVTDINGCNEIISEGENGTIIPVKNSVALQEQMERLFTRRELTAKLSVAARKIITDRYEQRTVWSALLREYKFWENRNNNV